MFEGSYIKLGPDIADTPLPFFSIDSINIEQVMASAAIYYRLADWDRGYLDVFAGARYMYLNNQLNFTPDSAGISSVDYEGDILFDVDMGGLFLGAKIKL